MADLSLRAKAQCLWRWQWTGSGGRLSTALALLLAWAASMGLAAAPAAADQVYRITEFEIEYEPQIVPGVPTAQEILTQAPIRLSPSPDGWIPADPELEVVVIRLADVPDLEVQDFTADGLRQVSTDVFRYMLRQDIMGVVVRPDSLDIHLDTWADRRPPQRTQLRLVIMLARVSELRTLASGDRVREIDRINHPAHARILRLAPVEVGDRPIRRDELDAYIQHLNRHPGRRVDVAVAEGEADDEVILDFQVDENRPWMLFAQASNTGTKATTRWRQRFGFVHSQLTGRDDILNVQYITGNFNQVHSVMGFYETPVGDIDWLRFQVSGSWGQFDASEVGFADLPFEGEQWMVGVELSANVLRHRDLFLDVYGGARWHHLKVENPFAFPTRGEDDLFMPHFGVRAERRMRTSAFEAQVQAAFNLPGVANTQDEPGRLQSLGRIEPDRNFTILSAEGRYEFYLDPLLWPGDWEDPDSPYATLAHRVVLSIEGQTSFNRRLVAQQQRVVGGLHSVRGYDESVVAGDTALIGRLEYNFHLPRTLPRQEKPSQLLGRPFRWAPDHAYGRADWDLIVRTFVDGGATWQADRRPFETNESLLGTGLGLELLILQHASLRADWGIALLDVKDAFGRKLVSAGSNRFHLQFTLFY